MKKNFGTIYSIVAIICLVFFVFGLFDMIHFISYVKEVNFDVHSRTIHNLFTKSIILFILGIVALGGCLFLVFGNNDCKKLKIIISILLIIISIVSIFIINMISKGSLKIDNYMIMLDEFTVWIQLDSATKGMFVPVMIVSAFSIVKFFIKETQENN